MFRFHTVKRKHFVFLPCRYFKRLLMFVLVSALHLVPEGHFPMQCCDITDRKDAQFVVYLLSRMS